MLNIIPLLSILIFAAAYPLCFWISARDPLKNNFHHFHLGLPNVLSGLGAVGLYLLGFPFTTVLLAGSWFLIFCIVSLAYWKKETVALLPITLVSFLGFCLFIEIYSEILKPEYAHLGVSILGGLILAAAFYAMNLGHWYLNVHGLPLSHLILSVRVFGILLSVRFVWDIYVIATHKVLYLGEYYSVFTFLFTMDGFLLLTALFFGTIFPLLSLYFVAGTLQVKNTQATTGILYAILSGILIGDIAYKYYLIKHAIPL